MQRIIGIDFGTSTTYMNVKRYDGDRPVEDKFSYMPVMFNYGESSGHVASIVRENTDGSFDFGERAMEPLEGARVHTEIKMRLESPDEQERLEARRITELFFRFLFNTYTQQADSLGGSDDEEETLVSYPVKWSAETRQFMIDAAAKAGFRNVRGVDEASAAVVAVLFQSSNSDRLFRSNRPSYLLLADMGAGTTDLVVCKYKNDNGNIAVKMLSNWPLSAAEPTFGGREVDRALENYVEDYLKSSLNLGAGKPVTSCGYISAYAAMLSKRFPAFSRKEFEQMIAAPLQDFVRLLFGCLTYTSTKDAGFAGEGLDAVILTGGHSAWYFAREILDGTLASTLSHPALERIRADKTRVINLPNPQTTVSLGLVYSRVQGIAEYVEETEQEHEEEKGQEPKEDREPARAQVRGEALLKAGIAAQRTGDSAAAFAKFSQAASLGNTDACYYLGLFYAEGQSCEKDPVKAEDYLRAAAEDEQNTSHRLAAERLEQLREPPKRPDAYPVDAEGNFLSGEEYVSLAVVKYIKTHWNDALSRIFVSKEPEAEAGVYWRHVGVNSGFTFQKSYIQINYAGKLSRIKWADFLKAQLTDYSGFVIFLSRSLNSESSRLDLTNCSRDDFAVFFQLIKDMQEEINRVCPPSRWNSLYRWDSSLEQYVTEFIHDSRFRAVCPGATEFDSIWSVFRQRANIPMGERMFFGNLSQTLLKKNYGKAGFAICSGGIYSRNWAENVSFRWSEFLNRPCAPFAEVRNKYIYDDFCRYLREKAALLACQQQGIPLELEQV